MKNSFQKKDSRRIKDIKYARFIEKPEWANTSKSKGAIERGLKYERQVQEKLKEQVPQALSGPWIEYIDSEGKQFAQPDMVLITQDRIYCIEIKLTYKESALRKLDKFYRPLLQHIFQLPVHCIMVYKNSKPNRSWKINSLIDAEHPERIYTWNLRC